MWPAIRKWLIRIAKGIGILLVVLIILRVSVAVYWDLNSGYEILEVGTGFGVTIGSTKEEVFDQLLGYYTDPDVIVSGVFIRGAPPRFSIHREFARPLLLEEDEWDIKFSLTHPDLLSLEFEDGKLVRAVRAWAPMELP